MASRQTSNNPEPDTGPVQGEQAGGGLADMLSGLLGGSGGAEPNAALQGLLQQLGGGQEGGIDDVVARLFAQGGAQSDEEGARLSPELLKAVESAQAAGGAGAVPDALKRALEALGVSPALLEKLLPAILGKLTPQAQAEEKPAPKRRVRKSTSKPKATAKPRETAAKPAGSSSRPKQSSSTGTTSGKSRASKKKSGQSSAKSTASSRRKRSSQPEGLNLDDLLKNLTQ